MATVHSLPAQQKHFSNELKSPTQPQRANNLKNIDGATLVTPPTVSENVGGRRRRTRAFKVILLGDTAVGKTCLSFRFCNGRFPEQTDATIGVDFRERLFHIDREVIRIQLWDTAGQERFRHSMTTHYYRNVNSVVFVYDVTRRSTFESLSSWVEECRKHVNGDEIPMILIGNKSDESSAVSTSEAQQMADKYNMPLFETSAKADSQADYVESILMTLVHKLRHSKSTHVQSKEERETVKLAQNDNSATEAQPADSFCGCL